MRYKDDIQGGEFVTQDSPFEPDNDGVEDDATFEDKEGGELYDGRIGRAQLGPGGTGRRPLHGS